MSFDDTQSSDLLPKEWLKQKTKRNVGKKAAKANEFFEKFCQF